MPVLRDDMSEQNSVCGYPDSPRSNTPSTSPIRALPAARSYESPTLSSPGTYATPNNREVSLLIENHQKNMKKDVDECKEFVVQHMDKIMNVLEQRLTDGNTAKAA
jgi:hypothetical protein